MFCVVSLYVRIIGNVIPTLNAFVLYSENVTEVMQTSESDDSVIYLVRRIFRKQHFIPVQTFYRFKSDNGIAINYKIFHVFVNHSSMLSISSPHRS